MRRILFIFGTRPEAIKCAPLVKEFEKNSDLFTVKTCVTAQHREMLDQVLDFFCIKPSYDLNLMKENQSLFSITADSLNNLENVIDDYKPDIVVVQGDTTTAFIGALAGFYKKITVFHLEAGLRSFDRYAPFPEEMNRLLISQLADYYFVPTRSAKKNLLNEGIRNNIYVVGNTVVDALFLGLSKNKEIGEDKFRDKFSFLDFSRKILLVTGHRRESFGKPFEEICNALKSLSTICPNIEIVYPVHLNPQVRVPVFKILKNLQNVHLIQPLSYSDIIWLMNKSYLVLTDSGGIQEEAPSLGKPVLVMRDKTERVEGIKAGTAMLVGTKAENIIKSVLQLMNNNQLYNKMAKASNPYGDGNTSKMIVSIVKKRFF